MIFNSPEFFIFLPVVFGLYWLARRVSVGLQNWILLTASYVFYGWWDWRFLSLIALSSVIDFYVSNKICASRRVAVRRALLGISLLFNLGCLAYFKYCNFFVDSWNDAMSVLGLSCSLHTLNVILPVGISFYTFQTLSYSIDVYRGKLKPASDLIEFFTFVSFFPQLVAGPIERATHLLPQIQQERRFDYDIAVSGVRLMFWGMIKKVVIGDRCGVFASKIFDDYSSLGSVSLALGVFYFAVQIYCDFSGYSDIAIGTARLFGIDLNTNFRRPYFSKSISEFWRRWHISLSSWFRDYVYIPLGGSRCSRTRTILNVMIVFLLSGFWHGASWNFVVWGMIHGVLFIPASLLGKRVQRDSAERSFWTHGLHILLVLRTFVLVCFGWVFFRCETLEHAFSYLKAIGEFSYVQGNLRRFVHSDVTGWIIVGMGVDLLIEKPRLAAWVQSCWLYRFRILAYGVASWSCMRLFQNGTAFIYFQF